MLLQVLISGLVIGSIYGLIALGYSLIYKASGVMSFAQGDMLTLGAFLGFTCYSLLGIPFFLSIVLVMAIMFCFGMLLERSVINHLIKRNVQPIYTILATIAVSYLIQNGSMIVWGSDSKFFPSLFKIKSLEFFGIKIQTEAFLCIAISLVGMMILHLFIKKTKVGTAMRATAMDPMAAKACGINVQLTVGITWGLSAGIAALAGMLIGPVYGVYTTLGANIGRKGFSSAVIGGYGNMVGAVVGGALLGIMETFTAAFISSAYKDLFAYLVLLIFLFVKPTGIFNEKAIVD